MNTEDLIPKGVAARLASLVAKPQFLEEARGHFPIRDHWRKIDDQGFWRMIVSQICVVGDSSGWERMEESGDVESTLSFSTLLAERPESRSRVIHRVLRLSRVRYASRQPGECKKTAAIIRNLHFLNSFPGRAEGYLKSLAEEPDDRARVGRVSRDLAYIKNKGARDLLIELDLGKTLIALDVRVLGILKLAGTKLTGNVQGNRDHYEALESAVLREICDRAGLTGAEFDRVVYWNYTALKTELGDCTD